MYLSGVSITITSVLYTDLPRVIFNTLKSISLLSIQNFSLPPHPNDSRKGIASNVACFWALNYLAYLYFAKLSYVTPCINTVTFPKYITLSCFSFYLKCFFFFLVNFYSPFKTHLKFCLLQETFPQTDLVVTCLYSKILFYI